MLKLIDLGKLSYDTPVGDYLPAFKNPVVVDRTSTLNTTFKPAQTTVTVKHLLNFSSGLFYPVIKDDLFSLPIAYTSKEVHAAADPLSEYFKILLVGTVVHYGVTITNTWFAGSSSRCPFEI